MASGLGCALLGPATLHLYSGSLSVLCGTGGVGLPALAALDLVRLHYKLGGSAALADFLQGGLKE